jgi:cation transport ATPase
MADKNAFGVEQKTKENKEAKVLAADSIYAHLDTDGDGIITDEEMARAKEIAEFEHKRKMQENEDAKEDQIRQMAWFALWGMLLYPVLILATSIFGVDDAAQLIGDIAPTYFVAIAGLVAAFFGAQAYSKGSSSKKE